MEFNNMVNAMLIITGILEFLGMLGGLFFLVVFLVEKIEDYQANNKRVTCETCVGYNACFKITGGDLPDYVCAYYKSDEEVEISAK